MSKHSTVAKALLFAPLLAGLGGCAQDSAVQAQTRQDSKTQVRQGLGPVPATLDTATAAHLSGAFRGAADRALPAVVQVSVTTRAERSTARLNGRQMPFDLPGFPGSGDGDQ